MMRLAGILVVLLGVFGTAPGAAADEPGDLSLVSAINKAGRQRMLSQRIVLLYCQAGLGVMPDASRAKLAEVVDLFDAQLTTLRGIAPTPTVRDALVQVEQIWTPFAEIARRPPDRAGAERLLYWNDDLLFLSNKVVQLLQDQSDEPYARLVNIAGRQRMLSQRAAKFYMLQEWGFDSHSIRDELDRARSEFIGALEVLRAAPESTDAIREALDDVEQAWAWFDNALTLRGAETFRLVVADSTEAILDQMDRVTAMYERLPSEEP